jgi:hypothetical protein
MVSMLKCTDIDIPVTGGLVQNLYLSVRQPTDEKQRKEGVCNGAEDMVGVDPAPALISSPPEAEQNPFQSAFTKGDVYPVIVLLILRESLLPPP